MSAAPSISFERRTFQDVIAPEGFQRAILDRSIHVVEPLYCAALEEVSGPIDTGAELLEENGELSILDMGCGTGNMLRTWADEIADYVPDTLGRITLTGINQYDYSEESMHYATISAIKEGRIKYRLGDAADMREIADDSVHVCMASYSMMHSERPEQWVREMLRVTRNNGYAFFNTSSQQAMVSSPLWKFITCLQEEGHELASSHVVMSGAGRTVVSAFCRLSKARRTATHIV